MGLQDPSLDSVVPVVYSAMIMVVIVSRMQHPTMAKQTALVRVLFGPY